MAEYSDSITGTHAEYLAGQRLGRLATVGADGAPHNVPRGTAAAMTQGGESIGPGFAPEFLRVTPTRVVHWGL